MAIDRQMIFLDTAYVNALINTRDQWHQTALLWERRLATDRTPLVTTEFVLVEIADGLAVVRFRVQAAAAPSALRASRFVEIIPASSDFFAAGLRLYQSRPDKDWGLTDCTSFVAMGEHGLSEALTTDEHFRQARFRALLLEDDPKRITLNLVAATHSLKGRHFLDYLSYKILTKNQASQFAGGATGQV